MMGIKQSKNRIPFVLSLIAIMLITCMHFAFAEDNVSMPDLKQDKSDLRILTQYADKDVITPIKGMELSAYKVADLAVSGGSAKYTASSGFESAGIDFNSMTTESSIKAASELAKIAETGSAKALKAASDANGIASFGQVENGMYLIVQTGAIGDAENYTRLTPYILMAPQPLLDLGQNAWEYDVVSIPKMEVLNKIIKIDKKVNQEDDSEVARTDKFSYDILAEIGYVPDSFAIVDNVPDPLEIVDQHRIEIRVGDRKLSDSELRKMLKIEGNTLRVEVSKKQLEEWIPLEMSIMFYCRFRDDFEFTEETIHVVNRAGYEVEGEYFEPPGDDHEATVKGVYKPSVKDVFKKVQTGDANYIIAWSAALIAALVVIAVIVRRRRRSN